MQAVIKEAMQPGRPPAAAGKPYTTYHEKMYKGILYRITNEHHDRVKLGTALENLTVQKILRMEESCVRSR